MAEIRQNKPGQTLGQKRIPHAVPVSTLSEPTLR